MKNQSAGVVELYAVAKIVHEHSCCNGQYSGERHGARGEDFRSETRLFPLAPSLAPLAWPTGTRLCQTIKNNAG